jgi:hypothetical protein
MNLLGVCVLLTGRTFCETPRLDRMVAAGVVAGVD